MGDVNLSDNSKDGEDEDDGDSGVDARTKEKRTWELFGEDEEEEAKFAKKMRSIDEAFKATMNVERTFVRKFYYVGKWVFILTSV